MISFFASANWRIRFAERGPIESHAARIDAPIAPVAAMKNRRRSIPNRSAACPGIEMRSGERGRGRRRIVLRLEMNEWSRVAHFGGPVFAILTGDHRQNRIRIDREDHEDVTD